MLLLHLSELDEKRWAQRLGALLGDYPLVRRQERFEPADVRYVLVWKPDQSAFEGLNNLKAILSLGAGVDALVGHKGLPRSVPIVRFVNEELSQCMSDYVVASVTMHQRCFPYYQRRQSQRDWTQYYPPPAWEICVGIMGLGVLGTEVARRLGALGFEVAGWTRGAKQLEGVKVFSGDSQFERFLSQTDILVDLLPLTAQTRGILNYETFSKLRRTRLKGGPTIINAARGGHQNEDDIVRALEDGTLGAASLDVFNSEPLPANSALWGLKNCYITPHVAAISNPESGASYFAHVVREHERGQPLINVVDLKKGY